MTFFAGESVHVQVKQNVFTQLFECFNTVFHPAVFSLLLMSVMFMKQDVIVKHYGPTGTIQCHWVRATRWSHLMSSWNAWPKEKNVIKI